MFMTFSDLRTKKRSLSVCIKAVYPVKRSNKNRLTEYPTRLQT